MSEECPATFQACQNSLMSTDICPTVLWAPATTAIPDKHGETPCMPLGINSMAGTDVCHTKRRRRDLPHASNIKQCYGRLQSSCTQRRGQQDLAYVHSLPLTCEAIPFIYKRGCALSQTERWISSLTHNSRTTRFKPRAYAQNT